MKSRIIVFSIIVVIVSLTIGYSAFSNSLLMSNIGAIIRVESDIRVTNIEVSKGAYEGTSNYEEYNISSIQSRVFLPNRESSVTYKVSITNFGNVEMGIFNITGLSDNLYYKVEDYSLRQKVCNTEKKCTLGITKDFYITIGYKNYDETNVDYDVNLEFDFRQFYNISYYNFLPNNYPKQVIEGDTLELELDNDYTKLLIYMNNILLKENVDFILNEHVLTIYNVSGNIDISNLISFVNHISSLYNSATKKEILMDNSEIVYQSDEVKLKKDSFDNIRYYSKEPNNYVYFNNELWRIIGIFDVEDEQGIISKKVKIVRNSSIGKFSYDNKTSSSGSASQYENRQWSQARLMRLLNPNYDLEEIGGSLYWNRGSGNCYKGQNNATVECDFSSIGLTNDSKNMISLSKYTFGRFSSTNLYQSDVYKYEKETFIDEWIGHVGLIDSSDYLYAIDNDACTGNIASIKSNHCYKNSYLYTLYSNISWIFGYGSYPTTSAFSNEAGINMGVNINGRVFQAYNIFPALYLDSDTYMIEGTGEVDKPYKIGI